MQKCTNHHLKYSGSVTHLVLVTLFSVKICIFDSQSRLMFEGEAASLEAIVATNTVRVPKPIKVSPKTIRTGTLLIYIRGVGSYFEVEGWDMVNLPRPQKWPFNLIPESDLLYGFGQFMGGPVPPSPQFRRPVYDCH